ncbi:MAG: glycosyltransferase [Solirubrobacteraceae bacterium]
MSRAARGEDPPGPRGEDPPGGSGGGPALSVIVRARDEAAGIGRCLALIGAQRTPGRAVEAIVVDSGSRDQTVAIARDHHARVITIPKRAFTFGAALNLGAASARGEIIVALSAHAFALDDGWLERVAASFSDPRVACACGEDRGPDGARLRTIVRQDIALARRAPQWGYSNGAGAFRAELWRERQFRADLAGCEDKEWALHWLERGYVCTIDPALSVEHDHTRDSLSDTYVRARREAAGYAAFLALGPYGPRELAREWWSERGWHSSPVRARCSPRRAARLLGAYAGRRAAGG